MQPDGIDIGISRPFRLELRGALKLAKRLGGPFKAGERQSERMVQPRIQGRPGDRRAQHSFPFGIPAELPVEIGEIDRRRHVLRAQTQRGLVFSLGIHGQAAPRVEASERGARFGPIGVEALGGDELGCRTLEAGPVGGRLARRRNRGEERGRPTSQ